VQSVSAATLLIPVGEVIGLQLKDDRVTVEGFDDSLGAAATAAGLEEGDQILSIDDVPIHCAEDIRQALKQSDGDVEMHILRGKQTREIEIDPVVTENGPKLGIVLKEGITGIGTVTYYDPASGTFGALGHGVNDPDGDLVVMTQGFAFSAQVDSVRRGKTGEPGQLMGSVISPNSLAQLSKNTPQGVFGAGNRLFSGDPLPAATASEIQAGAATIRSTVQGNTVQEYSVEILKIYPSSGSEGRNLLLKVTDPALLETTGGIVQGMSGSPIIQDGKLVGAVTHVLVNDPTRGYGIFIENMLEAAE
jgi:stage IV sporulation protein B